MIPNGLQFTIIGSSGIDSELTLPPCYLGKMSLKKSEISPIRSLSSHLSSTLRRESNNRSNIDDSCSGFLDLLNKKERR